MCPRTRSLGARIVVGSRENMRSIARIVGAVIGLYLVGRAVVEPFLIDMSDPATYRDDWGGPSLLGVLLVHSGLGLAAGAILVIAFLRRRSPHRSQAVGSEGER
jgi:hypothetical protein